jgi:hypothetical protein
MKCISDSGFHFSNEDGNLSRERRTNTRHLQSLRAPRAYGNLSRGCLNNNAFVKACWNLRKVCVVTEMTNDLVAAFTEYVCEVYQFHQFRFSSRCQKVKQIQSSFNRALLLVIYLNPQNAKRLE